MDVGCSDVVAGACRAKIPGLDPGMRTTWMIARQPDSFRPLMPLTFKRANSLMRIYYLMLSQSFFVDSYI